MTKERLEELRVVNSVGSSLDLPVAIERLAECLDEIEECWADIMELKMIPPRREKRPWGLSGYVKILPGSLTDPNKEGAAC
jgi:hypothetical protein